MVRVGEVMSMWLGWEGSCVCSEEGGRGHVHVVRRVGGVMCMW